VGSARARHQRRRGARHLVRRLRRTRGLVGGARAAGARYQRRRRGHLVVRRLKRELSVRVQLCVCVACHCRLSV
jgi:hypothetical protein